MRRRGWVAVALLAAAAVAPANDTREIDARILEDLDFYRYLDVLESEPLLQATEGEEEPPGADSGKESDRGGESR